MSVLIKSAPKAVGSVAAIDKSPSSHADLKHGTAALSNSEVSVPKSDVFGLRAEALPTLQVGQYWATKA